MVSKSDYSFNIEEFLPPGSDYFAKNKVEIRKNLPKNENLFKKKESLFDITKFNVFSPVIDVERFTQKENTGTIDQKYKIIENMYKKMQAMMTRMTRLSNRSVLSERFPTVENQ